MKLSPDALWAIFWVGLVAAVAAIALIHAYNARLANTERHTRDLARIEQGQCETRSGRVSVWHACRPGEGVR